MMDALTRVLAAHGWRMRDAALYRTVVEDIGSAEWERMEFLGDAVINLAVAHAGFHRHPDYAEGALSRYRTALVCGATLAQLSRHSGLAAALPPGLQDDAKLHEDVFECLVAAAYLDSSFEECYALLMRVMDAYGGADAPQSHARRLRRVCRNRTIDITADVNDAGAHWCCVKLDGMRAGVGAGRTRRDAEELACKHALEYAGHSVDSAYHSSCDHSGVSAESSDTFSPQNGSQRR